MAGGQPLVLHLINRYCLYANDTAIYTLHAPACMNGRALYNNLNKFLTGLEFINVGCNRTEDDNFG